MRDATIGIDLGYNYQFENGHIGAEADFGRMSLSQTLSDRPCAIRWIADDKHDDQRPLRGRLGFAFDETLIYATGGAA